MKLLLLTALATVACAEPWGYYGYPAVGNSPTLQWPGYSGPGFSRQTFGLRGKRSAEPEPYYGYYGLHPYGYYGLGRGVAGHAGGGFSWTQRSPQGLGKRSADEEEPAKGAHPGGATSYVGNTVWGFPAEAKAKRSAEPEPYYPYYYHQQNWPSIRVPGFSSTVYGARGKRSAEPEAYYGYLHQQNWPSVRAPGFSATTYGARPYGYAGYYWG